MIYDFKQYELQDWTCKGEMRRRYSVLCKHYKKHDIYKYVRGHELRYGVYKEKTDEQLIETDDLDEAMAFIDEKKVKVIVKV